MLIATMLSAQCTDLQVNKVAEKLFKKYRNVTDYVKCDLGELEADIYSTGFYRNKAKNIKAMCNMLVEKFNGQVPNTMAELVALPGVARKTANIVLGNSYGIVDGIAVDTHVSRVSLRLGLTKETDPVKIEIDLMKILPKKEWFASTYLFIEHGRKTCHAKKPLCPSCPLQDICPSAKGFMKAKKAFSF
jgi:endonuclease-3